MVMFQPLAHALYCLFGLNFVHGKTWVVRLVQHDGSKDGCDDFQADRLVLVKVCKGKQWFSKTKVDQIVKGVKHHHELMFVGRTFDPSHVFRCVCTAFGTWESIAQFCDEFKQGGSCS